MKKKTFHRLVLATTCCFAAHIFIVAQVQNYAVLKPQKVSGIENFTFWRGTGITFARSPLSYPYAFINPVSSAVFCDPTLQTGTACNKPLADVPPERYLIAGFGPRMTVSGGLITRKFDFHLGADIIDRTQNITNANPPEIKCMCAGKVIEVDNVNDNEHGLSVTVRCNDVFEGMGTTGWGNICMAFRHLGSIQTGLIENQIIKKGDVIGIMGNTGTLSNNNHLHLSLQREENGKRYNVHPMRAFNPEKNPHIIQTLDNSEMEIHFLNINTWQNDGFVIFRIAVPHYQAGLEMISLRSGTVTRKFDIEQRSYACHDNTTCLDDNSFDNMELFVFPFTRLKTAYQLYDDHKGVLEAGHTGIKYPIKDTGVFKKSAYVIDIKTTLGSTANIKAKGIEVYVSDIWGQGVRAVLPPNGI